MAQGFLFRLLPPGLPPAGPVPARPWDQTPQKGEHRWDLRSSQTGWHVLFARLRPVEHVCTRGLLSSRGVGFLGLSL